MGNYACFQVISQDWLISVAEVMKMKQKTHTLE